MIRVGHITDLHARHHQPGTSIHPKRRSREVLGMLPNALRRLREHQVDFLAVTGDLLDVPDEVIAAHVTSGEAFERAIDDYKLVQSILDSSAIPYLVLPGNHDLESAMWSVFPRQAHEMIVNGHRILRFCDREGEAHVPHRLGEDRQRWTKLVGDCTDDRPQIHLQHYVITPDLNVGYPHTYSDGSQIRAANTACGRCVLCISGHYHKGTDLIHDVGCTFVTGSAFCEPPHAFRVYEIDGSHVTAKPLLVNA